MDKEASRCVIMGCACIITSALTVEQIEQYKLCRPEPLELTDDNKTIVALDIDDGPGYIDGNNVVYSRVKDPEGRATITLLLDPEAEDKVELVRKRIGATLLRLNDLEEQMLQKIGDVETEIVKMNSMITWA